MRPETAPTPQRPAAAAEPQTPTPEPERVPGFKVGDTLYTFPAVIPPGWTLTYLRLYYGTGQIHAAIWSLVQLLGIEQQAALERDPGLTREALAGAIVAARAALIEGVNTDA